MLGVVGDARLVIVIGVEGVAGVAADVVVTEVGGVSAKGAGLFASIEGAGGAGTVLVEMVEGGLADFGKVVIGFVAVGPVADDFVALEASLLKVFPIGVFRRKVGEGIC
jgi:hypothetical protein